MSWPSAFLGDVNETLKQVQAHMAWELIGYLINSAKKRYLRAERLIGVKTELGTATKRVQQFECYHFFFATYDQIAAYFRFESDSGGQLELIPAVKFIVDLTYEQMLEVRWRSFFEKEVATLIDDDEVVIAILTIITPATTVERDRSLKLLREIIEGTYGDLPRSAKDRIAQKSRAE
jgi:hypothetical protein